MSMTKKVGSMLNAGFIDMGARSGADSVMLGSAIGAGAGAINGSFSDYEGTFSGAFKGAMVGGIGAGGLKMAGSRYANNYAMKVSKMSHDVTSKGFNDRFAFDPKLFKEGVPEGMDSFNDSFGAAKTALTTAGTNKVRVSKMIPHAPDKGYGGDPTTASSKWGLV